MQELTICSEGLGVYDVCKADPVSHTKFADQSADIIKHLYKNYGPGEAPDALLGVPMTFGASLNLLPRLGKV